MGYSGAYVFGDSLVDAGNALKLAEFYGTLTFSDLPEGAPSADLGYFQGRFSNGYTFADLISNKTIGVVTQPVFPFGYDDPWIGVPIDPFAGDPNGNNLNFAYGGSQIRQGDEAVPDLDGQTDAFKDAVDGHADPNALYMVTVGGNDVRSLAPAGSDPASVADAHAALDAAAVKLLHELQQLIDIGVHNLLITGVPDVGLIPKYDQDGILGLSPTEHARADAATEYSVYLDTLIRTQVVPALEAMGADVTYVPIMGSAYVDSSGRVIDPAFAAVLPEIAALHGLSADELSNNLLQYQNLVFFDQIHPTAQTHALVASYMYAQLSGTPWVETMPLAGADVDYHATATIGAAGEVDSTSIYLIAGSTYTFDMLGVSSLGTAGSLGDARLSLVNSSGVVVAVDDDSGMGLDAALTFTVAKSGAYTLQASAVGMLTGSYTLEA
ncbi:MAG TPA: SGNH/GDSL hydrolase family protein, partial [Sphingomicrobium sp.]|nr:SGNH/GDSL hydrolase family protein [Sphingomicrobium sp.]